MEAQTTRNTDALLQTRKLSISLCNIRGLNRNVNAVHHHLSSSKPTILFLTETQISGSGDLTHLQFPNYSLFHCFRFKGGVCAYADSSVSISHIHTLDSCSPAFQLFWLKLSFSRCNKYYCCVYRSPNDNDSTSLFSLLNSHCEDILRSDPSAELCILGDFNAHNADWLPYSSHTDPAGRAAEHFSITNSFTQLVTFPTRIPDRFGDTAQTLDLFLTTDPSLYTVSCAAPIGSSDHCLLTFTHSHVSSVKPPCSRRVFWRYSSADWDGMRQFFGSYPWDCCYSDDPSIFAVNVTQVLSDGMLQYIPHFFKPGKVSSPDWFNHACQRAVRRKNKMFRRWQLNQTRETRTDYVNARNACSRVITQAKDRFIQKKAFSLANAPTGSRTFWSLAKAVGRNFCSPSFPPIFDPAGCPKSLSTEKAEIFADIFASTSSQAYFGPPPIYQPASKMFSPPTISTREVRRLLLSLDISKPPGTDGIPPILLRSCAPELAPIIAKLFRLSLSSGQFPSSWKLSHVLPIPKRGCLSDPNNYRPISITPILSKVFESLLAKQLLRDLEDNTLLSDHQYGFRKHRSTGDLLTYVSHVWSSTLDAYGEAEVITLDISKAFDRVWHAGLLAKLPMYGIHPSLVTWIGSFLSGRSIQVRLDGVVSRPRSITAGVPQGSVLSPTLFLLFINDLLPSISSSIHAFADDATIHRCTSYSSQRSASLHLCVDRYKTADALNRDLASVHSWGLTNAMSFNPLKSTHISISLHHSLSQHSIRLDSNPIPVSSSFTLLGILFSNNLSWSSHVKLIATRAAKKVGFLFRARKFFTPYQLLLLYKAQIRPCLEYCCHVWGGAPSSVLNLLDCIQNKVIRLISDPSLTDDLQSLSHRRDVAALSLFYRYYHGKCSSELASIVPPPQSFNRPTRLASSSHPFQVTIPRCRTQLFSSSFLPRTARLWNSLPPNIFPLSYNLSLFKSRVNSYLLNP